MTGRLVRPRTQLRGWMVVAVVIVAANAVWGARASVPPLAYPSPLAAWPLRVTHVSAHVSPKRGLVDVDVVVWNAGTTRQRGRVWWQLAPTDRKGSAWERRAYESRLVAIDLDGDSEATLHWSEQVHVPAGSYDVHAWAQFKRGSALVPSSGRRGVPPTVSLEGAPALLRHGPVPPGVVIQDVATRIDATGALHSDVTLHSPAGSRHGWLQWTVTPARGDILYWWRRAGSGSAGRYHEVSLAAGEDLVVSLESEALAPGRYLLRLALSFDDSPAVDGAGARDDVVSVDDIASVIDVPPRTKHADAKAPE